MRGVKTLLTHSPGMLYYHTYILP